MRERSVQNTNTNDSGGVGSARSVRAALAAALRHSRDVGPGTNDVPRGQITARATGVPELFQLYEEEIGGSRPARGACAAGAGSAALRGADGCLRAELAGSCCSWAAGVDQLMVVLQVLDMFIQVDQGIEVPKIFLEHGIPQRAVVREPLLVDQLLDVPVPDNVILARGRSVPWCEVAAPCRGYWWITGTQHIQWLLPEGFTASPGRYTNTGRVEAGPGPVTGHLDDG